ncbi:MAG: class I SAM-dependent methyltransferase [Candidatus Bathyarchaeia archaeon]
MVYVPFISSPPEVVKRMLELAEVRAGETLFDLGAGDGRILLAAVQQFNVKKAVGIEIREDLVKMAREAIRKLGLEDRIFILCGDMLEEPIGEADIVTLFLTTSANEHVRPKLEKELRDGARVVSHDYEISKWKPVKVENMGCHTLYLYVKGKS